MSPLAAVPDGVPRIDRVVPPVSDRRQRERRQAPFPEVPGEPDAGRDERELDEPPTRPDEEPDTERRIDIRVHGRVLPTGQFLPPPTHPYSVH